MTLRFQMLKLKKNDTEKIEKCFALVGNNNSWWHESDIVFPLARGVRD